MARQVRPWLAKPAPDEALRVRVSDRGANQQTPSGTAAKSRNQSPNVRVQSLPSSRHELRTWQTGGVHVRPAGLHGRRRQRVGPFVVQAGAQQGGLRWWKGKHDMIERPDAGAAGGTDMPLPPMTPQALDKTAHLQVGAGKQVSAQCRHIGYADEGFVPCRQGQKRMHFGRPIGHAACFSGPTQQTSKSRALRAELLDTMIKDGGLEGSGAALPCDPTAGHTTPWRRRLVEGRDPNAGGQQACRA